MREQQRRDGLLPRTPPPLPNTTSTWASIAEEQQAREAAVSGQIRVLRRELPALLERLGQIPNPRHPNKCRHRLTVLLLYGLLMFVFQFATRCEVNREMTRPQFEANLKLLFPNWRPCRMPTPCFGCCATSTSPTSNRSMSIWYGG